MGQACDKRDITKPLQKGKIIHSNDIEALGENPVSASSHTILENISRRNKELTLF